jgi:hypothetical protein
MYANVAPILAIFEKKVRLEVPLFQRKCVTTPDQPTTSAGRDLE